MGNFVDMSVWDGAMQVRDWLFVNGEHCNPHYKLYLTRNALMYIKLNWCNKYVLYYMNIGNTIFLLDQMCNHIPPSLIHV